VRCVVATKGNEKQIYQKSLHIEAKVTQVSNVAHGPLICTRNDAVTHKIIFLGQRTPFDGNRQRVLYDKAFLLSRQYCEAALKKPIGLPDLPGIILDKVSIIVRIISAAIYDDECI
jgi:hypothetical protein